MADCCLIKKVATVEVYENKNEVRAYGFMAGDKNTPMMEVKFRHLWGEENLSKCKLRWIIVDDLGSLLVGEVPIEQDNTASIQLPNELFNGERRMKVQLTVASCDGSRILNLQQFTDLKVINNLATNEVVEPVYGLFINRMYDEYKKYLSQLETLYNSQYGSLENLYINARNSLEQYLIEAENGGNAEFLQGYTPAMFQKVESTIADLKTSSKYKLGDVVEVLGFHAKGDGSHHKRVAKAEDDGSGELGQNGIWWCVVHDREINVSWFGIKVGQNEDTSGAYNTTVLEKVLSYNKSNYDVLIFPPGFINVITILFDRFTDKRIIFNNTILIGKTTTEQDGVVRIVGFAGSHLSGKLFIHASTNTFYKSALYIYSEKGNETNYSKFDSITIGYSKLAVKIGKNAEDDSLLSENVFHDIKTLFCAKALEFNGSQNVNTFMNCIFVAGGKGIDEIYGLGDDLDCITINGGSPTFIGGEVVAHAHNQCNSKLLKTNPCNSAIYGKDYPKVIFSGVHIETGKQLFEVPNEGGNGKLSTLTFDNCGGYVYLRKEANFSEINDPNYYGLVRIRNCNFYSQNNIRLAPNLYSKSPYSKLDIDTSSFTTGFVQGRAGIVGGIFRESNAEAISCTLTTGDTVVGKVNLVRGTIYNPNYQNLIKDGQIVVPNGCRTITITGFIYRSTDKDLTIRRNGVDFYYCINAKSNVSCVIPVKSGDIISIHSYVVTNIINSNLQISLEVNFEYTPITLKEMFYNPLIISESKKLGVYDEYKNYINELHEYENSQTSDETMLLPVLQEPVVPESVKQFAEKYKLI